MAIQVPTADFQTSALSGAINNAVDSMTIDTGLDIPATNGALQIDFDSTAALGASGGPETITYAAYNSGTGAVTGITRGAGGTTAVSHSNGASVQCGNSSVYFTALNALYDGWIPVTETWTRTSDTTFTVTGDYTSVLAIRDKIKVTDTTTKYFAITAVSYSAPDTTVTIYGPSGSVLAGSPTARWYSKMESPANYPTAWTTWTPTFGGFSANPTVVATYMQLGKMVSVRLNTTGAGTSNATTFTLTLPVAAKSTVNFMGIYAINAGSAVSARGKTNASSTTLDLYTDAAGSAWTNSGNKYCDLYLTYEAA